MKPPKKPEKREPKRMISFRLSQERHDALEEMSKAEDMTMTAVIEDLIRQGYEAFLKKKIKK